MKVLYASDPLALQRHHQKGADEDDMGYTPTHMLCMQQMTDLNLSLIQHFSICNSRAFTMSASYEKDNPLLYGFSALHVACHYGNATEELLKHLVQLDSTQTKKKSTENGFFPLGFLYNRSSVNKHIISCLLEVDSSAEVVGNGINGCIVSSDHDCMLANVRMLLKANPEAAKYRQSNDENLLHLTVGQNLVPSQVRIDVMKQILAIHKDAVRELDSDGWFPVHTAARYGNIEVMEFLVGLYPESSSMVTRNKAQNLLHMAVRDIENNTTVMKAKVRYLCSQYPAMTLQKDSDGDTPLHHAAYQGYIPTVKLLCESGGQEQVKTPVVHPTDAQCVWNGYLPLHYLISFNPESLRRSLLSDAAVLFSTLLRMYPEAVGMIGGIGVAYRKTPYQLAVDNDLPSYYLRLLLRAAPNLNPAELHRLNYEERRMALFLAFAARARATEPPFLARLRFAKMDLVKHVVSFL